MSLGKVVVKSNAEEEWIGPGESTAGSIGFPPTINPPTCIEVGRLLWAEQRAGIALLLRLPPRCAVGSCGKGGQGCWDMRCDAV